MRVGLLFLILCAGCGQDRGSVRIAIVGGSSTHLPVALAERLGYFKAEGVDVVLESLPTSQKTAESLPAGSADLATGGFDQVLQLRASGRAAKVVVVNLIRDPRSIVVSPTRKNVNAVGDLRGRTLGVPGLGSSNHMFAIHALFRSGVKAEEVSFTGIGVGPTLIAALERGVVDAAVPNLFEATVLRRRHPGIRVLLVATTPEGSKAIWGLEAVPSAVLFGREDWIAANGERLAKVGRADQRALVWLRTHSAEEIAALFPEQFHSGDREANLEGLRLMRSLYSPDGRMSPDGAKAVHEALALTQESLRNAKIDLSKTYTNQFVEVAIQ
jgi:NitT/TauT family transport system substrate-binding protein